MLKEVGASSLSQLMDETLPSTIRFAKELDLPQSLSEEDLLRRAGELAKKNQVFRSYIGGGYYGTHTPTVILRNILENPGWYTAYTPYQAEISQGRMEALLNFQTMIMSLTGMEIANASLLDEGTAAAEAVTLAINFLKGKSQKIFADKNSFPQTLAVLKTRCEAAGHELVIGDLKNISDKDFSGLAAVYAQSPSASGEIFDHTSVFEKAKAHKVVSILGTDLLALCLMKTPREMGAEIVVGSSQRFGVPFGFGGPHAAFMATGEDFKRLLPGRIIGVSQDAAGHPALRLALQTREQHIRREKATSNICTAQVLLAVMAGMYAVYHGPKGLKEKALHIHKKAALLKKVLEKNGLTTSHKNFFDTLQVNAAGDARARILKRAEEKRINLNLWDENKLQVSLDETCTFQDLEDLCYVFLGKSAAFSKEEIAREQGPLESGALSRQSSFLTEKVFNSYHSETEMLRYIHRLQGKDLSLTHSMIPLGSCTMKLNASSEMIPITWPEFANIHPFVPLSQAQGYMELIRELEGWLAEITGFSAVSLQPNAGSQGEYAGLLTIRKYQAVNGQGHRNVCLIPSSAHGTNPASAVMAGFKVVVVACDEKGNVELSDLKEKASAHADNLGALMITYPSTHGVFEESIKEICSIVHAHGGQVYLDGANMNAMVGLCRPADFGADVCHLNLHKTFCIPHGGGGPGVGPIGVAPHLASSLPTATTSAPWGSAGILPISWAYIAMMGADGLKAASEVSILNANYIAAKLSKHFKILYTGSKGRVAHECIVDVRPFKESAGVTVDDFAKRLMDYGFHAPTMSWPVAGTLMIEPTESESKEELDRFIEALISIREEIREIEEGKMDRDNNPLKMAPHSFSALLSDQWDHPYGREKAAFPLPWVRERKFWVPVSRVDNAYGDKNLVCSCAPLEAYT
jgi:glycine dehydrogenase